MNYQSFDKEIHLLEETYALTTLLNGTERKIASRLYHDLAKYFQIKPREFREEK